MDALTVIGGIAGIAMSITSMLAESWTVGKGIADTVKGEEVMKTYRKLSAKLADAMKKNDVLREKITQAYNSKNTKLLSSLVLASPVGAAYHSLQQQIKQADSEYKEQMSEITAKSSEINKAQNTMATAVQSGTSAFWNADSAKKEMENAADQAINGGIKENA